ncbi:MAG: DUF433 domain-containing protein [Vulcanimicrobiota bacterium]
MGLMLSEFITRTPGVCGGRPCIKGHRIRVLDVALMSERHGKSPDEIAHMYGLDLSQVHAALAYYFANLDEIREDIRRSLDVADQLRPEAMPDSRSA